MHNVANVHVKNTEGTTPSIKVTRSILQGEILSLLVFALFIADLEEFFGAWGCRGICIDHLHEVFLLAYADDITILAY